MKKVLFSLLMAIIALSFAACGGSGSGSESGSGKKANVQDNTGEYVDLGLPSGTLWGANNANEAYYTFDEAVEWFGNCLPTKDQLLELIHRCTWQWIGNGYKVIGLSGRSIFIPDEGFWSRTACEKSNNLKEAVLLQMNSENVKIDCDPCYLRLPIRLVKK